MLQVSVLVLWQCLTVVLCHNAAVLSQCLMLAQHTRIIALVLRALNGCSCAVNRCMGRKIEVEETASHEFWLLSSNFCAPIKVAPMARAMPATTAAEGRNGWYGQRGRTTRKKRTIRVWHTVTSKINHNAFTGHCPKDAESCNQKTKKA